MTEMALTASLQTLHRLMPNLLIAPDDRADIITYILSSARQIGVGISASPPLFALRQREQRGGAPPHRLFNLRHIVRALERNRQASGNVERDDAGGHRDVGFAGTRLAGIEDIFGAGAKPVGGAFKHQPAPAARSQPRDRPCRRHRCREWLASASRAGRENAVRRDPALGEIPAAPRARSGAHRANAAHTASRGAGAASVTVVSIGLNMRTV